MQSDATPHGEASGTIVIIVPCYNEARRLPVRQFHEFLSARSASVIFVDDGSSDETLGVLKDIRARFPEFVTILENRMNKGKAETVRRGIIAGLKENFEYVGFWDADLATPLSAVCDFTGVLRDRPDIDMVFGARVKLLGRRIERNPVRHYLGRIFATVVSNVLRLPVYDTQCGAKLFRNRTEIRSIFQPEFLSRWVFDVELIARYIRVLGSATKAADRIYEYPLYSWVDVAGSKVKPLDFFIALKEVAQIYWRYRSV